jgi:hypothetical protein
MKRSWLIGLAALIVVIGSAIANPFTSMAQSPSPSPTGPIGVPVAPIPVDPSLPANRPPIPGASPSPKASPNASPAAIPNVSVPATGQPPLQPAPVASPLPVTGTYKDPNGRFQVGILRNFSVSPLAGSVLIEARDGNLAYTVLTLPQSQLGVSGGVIDNDALVKVAQMAFKQGEGFETGEARTIPGGLQIDWVGNLTIAGNTQNVGGVILARPLKDNVALVLIAATEAGGDQVLGAASALGNSLQAL